MERFDVNDSKRNMVFNYRGIFEKGNFVYFCNYDLWSL